MFLFSENYKSKIQKVKIKKEGEKPSLIMKVQILKVRLRLDAMY